MKHAVVPRHTMRYGPQNKVIIKIFTNPPIGGFLIARAAQQQKLALYRKSFL